MAAVLADAGSRTTGGCTAGAPFETWGNAWYNAPCRTWAGKAGKPVTVTGEKAPPILLLSETLDAATPFAGSLEVRKRFPRAALIEGVGGTTHAGSLFGNACVDNAIADYLATGRPAQAGQGGPVRPSASRSAPAGRRAGAAAAGTESAIVRRPAARAAALIVDASAFCAAPPGSARAAGPGAAAGRAGSA